MLAKERKAIQQHIDKQTKALSKHDRAISDLLHDIELSKLDAIELTQDTMLLRKILRERRIIKNTLVMLSSLQSSSHAKSIVHKCEKAEPKYTPRELKGLKVAQSA